MKFHFGDIVVVDSNLIGVILKCNKKYNMFYYAVYVRFYDEIRYYVEELIQPYVAIPVYLNGEKILFQHKGLNNDVDMNRNSKLSEILDNTDKINGEGYYMSLYNVICIDSNGDPGMCTRVYNSLLRAKVKTIKDFLNKEPREIRRIRGLGLKSLEFALDIIYEYCATNNIKPLYRKEEYGVMKKNE